MYYDMKNLKDLEQHFDDYMRYFFRILSYPPEPWRVVAGFLSAMELQDFIEGFEILPEIRRPLYRRFRIGKIRYMSHVYLRLNLYARPPTLDLFIMSVTLSERRSKIFAAEAWEIYVDLIREFPCMERVDRPNFYLRFILVRNEDLNFSQWVSPREIIDNTSLFLVYRMTF